MQKMFIFLSAYSHTSKHSQLRLFFLEIPPPALTFNARYGTFWQNAKQKVYGNGGSA